MANFYSGPGEPIVQITASDTLYVELFLADAADPTAGKTGVTYDAAGMTVKVSKPGGAFADFPSFGTDNWAEVGYGWYRLAFRGGTAAELALLDTVGLLKVYVKATATKAANVGRKVIATRQAETADLANLDAAVSSREADGAAASAVSGLNDVSSEDVQTAAAAALTAYDPPTHAELTSATANLDAAVSSRALASTALSNATWTDAKAGYLDAAVTSRSTLTAQQVWEYGTRTLSSFGTLVADIWAALTSGLTGVGTIGKLLVDNVNAAIGTRSSHSPADVRDAILTDATRFAGANLDAAVSSREVSGAAATAVAGLNDLSSAEAEAAAAAALTAYDPPTHAELTTATANLDAAVSTRSTLTAQQVWEYGTRTLSGFGTLVADVATAVWGAVARTITGGVLDGGYDAAKTAAQPGDEMDLVDVPNPTAVTALQNGLSTLGADDVEDAVWDAALADHDDPASTGEALAGAGAAGDPWVTALPGAYAPGTAGDLLGNRLNDTITSREAAGAAAAAVAGLNDPSAADVAAAVWTFTPRTVTGISPEIGDSLVTVTLEDDGGTPVPGIRAGVYDAADNLLVVAATGGTGQFTCYLPDGDYTVVYGPQGANYAFANPYALTVAGNTTATHVCEAWSIPTSTSPDTCACYLYMLNISGAALGAGEGWLEVLAIEDPVWPRELDSGGVALARTGTKYETDENGLVTIELIRGSRVCLRVGGVADRYNRGELTFTVPDAATYNIATTR